MRGGTMSQDLVKASRTSAEGRMRACSVQDLKPGCMTVDCMVLLME